MPTDIYPGNKYFCFFELDFSTTNTLKTQRFRLKIVSKSECTQIESMRNSNLSENCNGSFNDFVYKQTLELILTVKTHKEGKIYYHGISTIATVIRKSQISRLFVTAVHRTRTIDLILTYIL